MKITVDKYFIEALNNEYDLDFTYTTFKKFYSEIAKPYRERSPEWQRKQRAKAYLASLDDVANKIIEADEEKENKPKKKKKHKEEVEK